MSDTITAQPSAVVGEYDSASRAMSLSLNVLFSDTQHYLPSHGEAVTFVVSTWQSIAAANSGMDANGSAVSSGGQATLVGSAPMKVTILFFSHSFTLGLKLEGTFATPLPGAAGT